MPYAGIMIPSIQLATLQAYLQAHDIPAQTRHLYLTAADTYGLTAYHALIYPPSDSYTAQLAYTRYLFPDHWHHHHEKIKDHYDATINKHHTAPTFDDYLHHTDDFYHHALDHLDWHHFDLIGFTLNYGQLLPSLAIAQHIKTQDPTKTIIMGGSRTTGDLGTAALTAFPQIDYIVSGDGEEPLRLLATDHDPTTIPGLIHRKDGKPHWNTTRSDLDLADFPIPTHDDFFTHLRHCGSELQQFFHYSGRLPVEISRGCWWNHCTFCNLNLQHPRYREKPIPTIITEIQTLADRHHLLDFHLIGNTLPKTQSREFFTRLRDLGRDYTFFAEARAGHLTSDDYRLMRDAGFATIQTGIESFSHHYLRTMNKGTRVIDNIAALKHSTQHGIHNTYNLLTNYPNETPTDYQETKDVAALLKAYLDPPQPCPLQLMHGSPIHRNPRRYNIQRLQPTTLDRLMYPPGILATAISFFYDYTTATPTPTHDWGALITDWKHTRDAAQTRALATRAATDRLVFYSVDGGSFMKVYDRRDPSHIRILDLNRLERDILLACTDITTYPQLQRRFPDIPDFKLAAVLQSFEHAGIVYREDDAYLSLPLRLTTPEIRSRTEQPDSTPNPVPISISH